MSRTKIETKSEEDFNKWRNNQSNMQVSLGTTYLMFIPWQ